MLTTHLLYVLLKHLINLKHAEETVFKMVDNKINELLDMVEYDEYLPVEKNDEANFAIKDFALFLENLFTSISTIYHCNCVHWGFSGLMILFLNIFKCVERCKCVQ